jgi:hypothetical protein
MLIIQQQNQFFLLPKQVRSFTYRYIPQIQGSKTSISTLRLPQNPLYALKNLVQPQYASTGLANTAAQANNSLVTKIAVNTRIVFS